MSELSLPGKSSPKKVWSFLWIPLLFTLDAFDPELLAVVTLATDGLLSSPKYASAVESLLAIVFPVKPVPGLKPGDNWEACDKLSLESL